MDGFDVKLLAALQDDGRLTNNELGEKVGLSASQCSRRRAALEQDGVIEGYHAALSPEALGLAVLAFVQVRLATHTPDNSRRFRDLVARTAEVQEAYALTGEADRFAGIWSALHDRDSRRGKPVKRGEGKQAAASLDKRPFAHPYYWSGFIYTGY